MTTRPDYPHLLSPGRIGPLELRNRIVMAPMGSFMGGEDGHITERHKRFYVERARGGVGLVTTEVVAVDYPRGAAMIHQLGLSDDRFVPGLRDLTDRVHAEGALISVQLQHAGKVSTKDLADGRPLSVPSAGVQAMEGVMEDLTPEETSAIVRHYTKVDPGNMLRELDEPEIRRIIGTFADAAERARRAGFDAVEVHAGHGYLVNEFLSRHTNKRTDDWGGPFENRARLLCEILREIRHQVGDDFGVWCRLDGEEKDVPDGITREDAIATACLAEAAGADAIHVSRYGGGSGIGFAAMIVHEAGELLPYAEAVKRAVDVPVIAVGRILPELAEEALARGRCDFVAMGRQLLADPELPAKLARGRRQDVRPCIHCYTCVGQIFVNEVVKCAVNPACAREHEFAIEPAKQSRHVLVVGGGPAGMEAARVAALRGHRVTLVEKQKHLGGTAFFSQLVYEPNGELVRWLEGQLRVLGVELRLGTEATPALVQASGAEAVVVATGARRELPDVPGADGPNVFSGDALRELLAGGGEAARKLSLAQRVMVRAGQTLLGIGDDPARVRELSKRWMPIGRRVAIVGGGLVGLELAEFMVERQRHVTVIEEGACFAPQMAIPRRWRTLHILREHGAELLLETRVVAFTERGVEVGAVDDSECLVEADTILLAAGVVPDHGLAEALGSSAAEVHVIGDADRVGYIEGAVLAGAQLARVL
ncbi:MAG: FAD-dependent oxidoreductase [Deltaproteobacteria bacterium]|nr:FAD-dependent oxidoreductase [Deltaproteobacteria bacterium]MBW2361842.1 FAD-dependent oxidoreductase [Deltaproteobacteria bacterium]